MGSDTVAAAFRAAVRDKRVKAILFRIDCNDGSYVASDAVLRETLLAKEAGKPVIVSMPPGLWQKIGMAWDRVETSEATVLALAQVLETIRPAAVLAERLGVIETYPKTLALPPEVVPQL